jgi:hypothetical protein
MAGLIVIVGQWLISQWLISHGSVASNNQYSIINNQWLVVVG